MPDSNSDYFFPAPFSKRQAMRPTAKTWAKHLLLFFLALFTITIAGVLKPFGLIDYFTDFNPQNWSEVFSFLISIPYLYSQLIIKTIYLLFNDFEILKYGLKFSLSLLFILTSHEAGHYIACRLYGVDATLPYFIPTPPLIGPAGTLGAFIKIVSPLPSRRATFDIGVAGPIAGFIALIPIAIVGIATTQSSPPLDSTIAGSQLIFADPLLTKLIAFCFGRDLSLMVEPNPFNGAAWVGLLVTSMNLLPSGQLDGGHALYALFGEKIHSWTSKIVFVAMAIISILGWFLYTSPSGLLLTILLGVMLRLGHPEPLDDAPLDFKRKIVAVVTLIIFILAFMPFPIQVI